MRHLQLVSRGSARPTPEARAHPQRCPACKLAQAMTVSGAVRRIARRGAAGRRLDEELPERMVAALGGRADVLLSDVAPASTGRRSVDRLRAEAIGEAVLALLPEPAGAERQSGAETAARRRQRAYRRSAPAVPPGPPDPGRRPPTANPWRSTCSAPATARMRRCTRTTASRPATAEPPAAAVVAQLPPAPLRPTHTASYAPGSVNAPVGAM